MKLNIPRVPKSRNLVKNAAAVFHIVLLLLLAFKPFGVYDPELRLHYFLTYLNKIIIKAGSLFRLPAFF